MFAKEWSLRDVGDRRGALRLASLPHPRTSRCDALRLTLWCARRGLASASWSEEPEGNSSITRQSHRLPVRADVRESGRLEADADFV
jgi:hypothetical protein